MSTDSETLVYTERDRTNDPFLTDPATLETIRSRIHEDIRSRVATAGVEGVVIPMSGGIDSTVTAVLAVEALGSDRVLGLGLPCHKSEQAGVSDAQTFADGLGIDFEQRQLRPLLEAFEETVGHSLDPDQPTDSRPYERNHAVGNVLARLRMCCAYYAANRQSRLVLGTANRSELLLGYFTKYGDGAADAFPIGDLYKTEVQALAKRLGVPRRIVSKEPTAGFWADQTDADELGASYAVIDPLLRRLVDEEATIEEAADAVGIDHEFVSEIAAMYTSSAHKRQRPPTPGVADRTNGEGL